MTDLENIRQIVKTILRDVPIKQAPFALSVDMDKAQVSRFVSGKSGISDFTVSKIRKAYPQYFDKEEATALDLHETLMEVHLVSKDAQAEYVLGYKDSNYIKKLPLLYTTKEIETGNYLAFEIKGDSMDYGSNAVREYDKVLAKELPRVYWEEKLHYNRYLFIIVLDCGVICKQITAHDAALGVLTCHSFNPFYEDFQLNIKEIKQLFYVKKIVERSIKL
jgi:hypothetical protein